VGRLQRVLAGARGPFRVDRNGHGHQARGRLDLGGAILDLRPLDGVLEVDQASRTAVVEPGVTMRQLVERTGRCGLAPPVVPEFPEITVGGAIQGLGAESASHRSGLFHESVEWMEVLLGDGTLLRVSPREHEDLWRALPGSYGSLAVSVLVCLRLEPRGAWVEVSHRRGALGAFLATGSNERAAFVDAVAVGDDEVIVTRADHVESLPAEARCHSPRWPRPYYCDHVMATTVEQGPEYMTFEDYVFRYDRGAFWIASTKLGTSIASRLLFSGFATASNLYALRNAKRALSPTPSRRVVQDCMVPATASAELVAIVREAVSGPLWLLPITARSDDLFGLRPGRWMNVGIYVRPRRSPAEVSDFNRRLEVELARLGGRKTLHADLFSPRDHYESVYDMGEYERLREHYRAQGALPHLFAKLGVDDRH
jgi:FAD/FMN-containing dehydrogenase